MQRLSFKVLTFSLFPFISFFLGYFIATYVFARTHVRTPNIIGKTLDESIRILSPHHLGIRLLRLQEDMTLPEGTVCDQTPRPHQKIRPNQDIFVTISTKKTSQMVPDFWGKQIKDCLTEAEALGLEIVHVSIIGNYPKDTCIAQLPAPGEEYDAKKVTLYISMGKEKLCVMPDFRGCLLSEVEHELAHEDIRAEIFHIIRQPENHLCQTCKITDQQPHAGTIIDISKGLQFQFKVATF